jgi:hypothetical protein
VIASGESSGVNVFGGQRLASGRTDPGRLATMRAVASSEPCSVVNPSRLKSVSGPLEEPTHCYTGEGLWRWGRTGDKHPSLLPAYGWWHVWKERCHKSGKVSVTAQTRSSGKDPPYNQGTGKSAGVVETGGSGRISDEGRDNITRLEQRTRGLRWSLQQPEAGGVDNTHRQGRAACERRRLYQTSHPLEECRPGA